MVSRRVLIVMQLDPTGLASALSAVLVSVERSSRNGFAAQLIRQLEMAEEMAKALEWHVRAAGVSNLGGEDSRILLRTLLFKMRSLRGDLCMKVGTPDDGR